MLGLTFNPGLALTGFRTTRPRDLEVLIVGKLRWGLLVFVRKVRMNQNRNFERDMGGGTN